MNENRHKYSTVKIRYSQGDRSHVIEHRCWNMELFIKSRQDVCAQQNLKLKPGDPRHKIEIVS